MAGAAAKEIPAGFTALREGAVSILQHGNDVFYNKAQVVNRDLSITMLRVFIARLKQEVASGDLRMTHREADQLGLRDPGAGAGAAGSRPFAAAGEANDAVKTPAGKAPGGAAGTVPSPLPVGIRVFEGLAATGLRALRYAAEIDGIGVVTANDLDAAAVAAISRNAAFNGLPPGRVAPQQGDARLRMLESPGAFTAVDIDPYGAPSIFLDGAVQAPRDGGLLMVTATDMAVLCGNSGEACWAKYGAYPVKGKYCHEMAVRILLGAIETHAGRYKRHIVPVLSVSIDFYVRVFVRIYTSPAATKLSPTKMAYLWQCAGCESFALQPVGRIVTKGTVVKYMPGTGPVVPQACAHCGKHSYLGGPMWAAPLHDPGWVSDALASVAAHRATLPAAPRLTSLLTVVSEELPDAPLYVSLHAMSANLKCTPPGAVLFNSAILHAGYRVSTSHACPLATKTDAPMRVLWDIMRCWVQAHPGRVPAPGTTAAALLAIPPTLAANFARAPAARSKSQAAGAPRFLPNPEVNWGPKSRAHRPLTDQQLAEQALGSTPAEASGPAPKRPRVNKGAKPEEGAAAAAGAGAGAVVGAAGPDAVDEEIALDDGGGDEDIVHNLLPRDITPNAVDGKARWQVKMANSRKPLAAFRIQAVVFDLSALLLPPGASQEAPPLPVAITHAPDPSESKVVRVNWIDRYFPVQEQPKADAIPRLTAAPLSTIEDVTRALNRNRARPQAAVEAIDMKALLRGPSIGESETASTVFQPLQEPDVLIDLSKPDLIVPDDIDDENRRASADRGRAAVKGEPTADVADIRLKYEAQMSKRKALSAMRAAGINVGPPVSALPKVSNSWSLQPGCSYILRYLKERSIPQALLLPVLGDEPSAKAIAQMQLPRAHFSLTEVLEFASNERGAGQTEEEAVLALRHVCESLGVSPGTAIVLSARKPVLRAARAAGMLTALRSRSTLVATETEGRGKIESFVDYAVSGLVGDFSFKEVFENINGVSLRASTQADPSQATHHARGA